MRKLVLSALLPCLFVLTAADFPVIYPRDATASEKHAAREIAEHLSLVCGRKISCLTEENNRSFNRAVYVGRTAFAAARNITVETFGEEEWLIRRFPEGVVVVGGRPRGTLFGAYEFLERFYGIMWLDELYTHIPRKEKLSLPDKAHLRGRPHFRWRGMYTWYGKDRRRSMAFRSRNRENVFLGVKMEPEIRRELGHYPVLGRPAAINTLFHYIKEWPLRGMEEGFSMNRVGKRVRPKDVYGPGQICFSSTAARKKCAEQMIGFIRADRKEEPKHYPRLYNLSVNDIKDVCHCTACREKLKKYGAESGAMLEFVNSVAEKVEKVYPDVRIQTSAYLDYEKAPLRGIVPRKNVTVRLSPSRWGSGFDTMRSLASPRNAETLAQLLKWSELGGVQIWNYWVLFGESPDVNACLVNIDAIRENLRAFSRMGADYVFSECEFPVDSTFNAMRIWIGYKLKCDPELDTDDLIDRFMHGYYGRAAGTMRAYYDYLVRRQNEAPMLDTRSALERPYLDADFFKTAENLIKRALGEAAGNSEHVTHVLNERVPLYIARLVCRPESEGADVTTEEVRRRLSCDWAFFIDRYLRKNHRKKALKRMADFLREHAFLQKRQCRYVLPKELADKYVIEIASDEFNSFGTFTYGVRFFDDPEAAGGKAMGFSNSERHPVKEDFHLQDFTCGIFDRQNKKALLKSRIGRTQMFQDEKFHFYRLGQVRMERSSLLWLHRSWFLQQNLGYLFRKNDPLNNEWTIYVSLKFTGPAYVAGSKKENAFYMDRILLVREKPSE